MHQVIQYIRNGRLSVKEIPDPIVKPGHVLVANAFSVISASPYFHRRGANPV